MKSSRNVFALSSIILIYNDIENVKELRQAILTLAVKGKLVPQDPKDEPASVLLERIKEEKERLINEKKIKRAKLLPPIEEDEIHYELPQWWEWVRLGEVCKLITDGTHKTPKYVKFGVPFLSVRNISQGYLDTSNIKYITMKEHIELSKSCKPERGDILRDVPFFYSSPTPQRTAPHRAKGRPTNVPLR